jgi:hypothetical protein
MLLLIRINWEEYVISIVQIFIIFVETSSGRSMRSDA